MAVRRRLSLQLVIILILAVGLAGTSAGTGALWLWHSETALSELGTQLRTQTLHRVRHRLQAHLDAPRKANELARSAIEQGLDLDDAKATTVRLADILRTLEPDYVAIGFPQGGLLGAERLDAGVTRVAYTEGRGQGTLTTFAYTPEEGPGKAINAVSYDASGRPWFLAATRARERIWSPVYLIATPPARLGITLADPLYDEAGELRHVVASDLIISNFSRFLAELDLDVEATVVVLDGQGRLVATSGSEPLLRLVGGSAERVHGSESADPAVAALVQSLGADGIAGIEDESQIDVSVQGEAWLVELAPVGDTQLDWVVAVMVPEDALLGAVQRSSRDTVLVSLFGLALVLGLGLYINRLLTRPLARVTEDLQRVARFELEPANPSRTPFREVAAIEDATERMKRGLRSFERYVSSDLVRSLIRTNQEATLGVEPVEITIFFSDIAGFTSLAETLPPKTLVEIVGAYLGEWSNLILFSGGTVDKFIGDAIMAFWNAPETVDDHPLVACDVALRCQTRLAELNVGWTAAGHPPVRSRIGLHTDTALVGNLGSTKRMDYTVVGDGVNLASRLEGLNKVYGTEILISEAVRAAVTEVFLTRPIDRVRVKGRKQTSIVHELVARRTSASEAELARCAATEAAFGHYIAKDFAAAARAYERLGDDPAAEVLAERCRSLLHASPGEDIV